MTPANRSTNQKNSVIGAIVLMAVVIVAISLFVAFPSLRNDPVVYRFASVLLALFAGAAAWFISGSFSFLLRNKPDGTPVVPTPWNITIRGGGGLGFACLILYLMFNTISKPLTGTVEYQRGADQTDPAGGAQVKLDGTNIEPARTSESGFFSFPDQAGATDIRIDYEDIQGATFKIHSERNAKYLLAQKPQFPYVKVKLSVNPVPNQAGAFRITFKCDRKDVPKNVPGLEVKATRNYKIKLKEIDWVAADHSPSLDNLVGPWIWSKKVEGEDEIDVTLEVTAPGSTKKDVEGAFDVRYRFTWMKI